MPKNKDTTTKDRLLKSGTLLFAEKGFGSVSVREICKHAETSMNMIHHYFKNKEGLLEAIVNQFDDQVFLMPKKLLEKPAKSSEDLISRIEMFFETTLDAYLENRDLLMLVDQEQPMLKGINDLHHLFEAFISKAQEDKIIRPSIKADMLLGTILDRIYNQVRMKPWIIKNYDLDIENNLEYKKEWCEANIDLFLNGMLN